MATINTERREINMVNDAMNNDWIRSARLRKKVEVGDEAAQQEFEELENTKMKKINTLIK